MCSVAAVCVQDAPGTTPPRLFHLCRPHNPSDKNTADIKSPYSRRAGKNQKKKKEISLGIVHITTGAQEHQRFRPRRVDKRKTWHTRNVKSTDDIYIKFSKTEGFTCHVVKEIKTKHKNTEHTHTHTLIDGQMPTQRGKKKVIIRYRFSPSFCYSSHNLAYFNPDWEESHRGSCRTLKSIKRGRRGRRGSV